MSPEPDVRPELVPGEPATSPYALPSLSEFPSHLEADEESQSESQLHHGEAWGWEAGRGW